MVNKDANGENSNRSSVKFILYLYNKVTVKILIDTHAIGVQAIHFLFERQLGKIHIQMRFPTSISLGKLDFFKTSLTYMPINI